jgi:hypothetical protein
MKGHAESEVLSRALGRAQKNNLLEVDPEIKDGLTTRGSLASEPCQGERRKRTFKMK